MTLLKIILLLMATQTVVSRITPAGHRNTVRQQATTLPPVTGQRIRVPGPPYIPPVVTQCFYESKWYPAGAIINAGRRDTLCYGAYCDLDGHVKHWSNHNCPKTDPTNTGPPFPNLTLPTTTPTGQGQTTPTPTTTMAPSFGFQGCFYGERYFFPGEYITMEKRGGVCTGLMCDQGSQVQIWWDFCRRPMIPIPLDLT